MAVPAPVAPYAKAAFALGWATVDDPDTLPAGPGGHAASKAAIAFAVEHQDLPGVLALVVEAGRVEAARQALHRARLRLYSTQRHLVLGVAAGIAAAVDHRLLARNLILTANQPRQVRARQAQTTLSHALYAVPGLAGAWNQANDTARKAAATRGRAEAAASDGAGPPDPKNVTAGLTAAAAAIGAVSVGGDWTDRQLRAQAWQLSGLDIAGADDPEQAVTDNLDQLQGAGNSLEDQMHGALTGAFSDYFNTGPGTTLGQIAWVTEEDDRVCPDCDANEENGPYPADSLPDMPAHPNCRCWFELA